MLVTWLNVSHKSKCKSHVSMLVTCLNVSHTSQHWSQVSMLVTSLNVSHTPQCKSHSLSKPGTRTRGAERPEVLVVQKSSIKAQEMSSAAMGKWRECPRSGLQPSYWLITPLIGQQPILVVLPSHWPLTKTPSDWSAAPPSLKTLLLAKMSNTVWLDNSSSKSYY